MLTRSLTRSLFIAAAIAALAFSLPAHAQTSPQPPNTTCPVMTGEPVKDDIFEDYQGQRIYFCCTKCQAKFRANPTKYLANLASFGGTGVPPVRVEAANPDPSQTPGDALSPNPKSQIENPKSTSLPLPSRFFRFLGRLHPLVVHFPIALLIVAGLLAGTGATRYFRAARDAMRYCLALGAMGAVAAAALGWLNAHYERGGYPEDTSSLSIHRWMGISVALLSTIAAVLVARAKPVADSSRAGVWELGSGRSSKGLAGPIAGLFLAALVAVTGHFGGLTAYGSNYLWEAFRTPQPHAAPSTAVTTTSPMPVGSHPALRPAPESGSTPTPTQAVVLPSNIQDLLYNSSDPEVFKIRRAARLAELVPPPGPEPLPEGGAGVGSSSPPTTEDRALQPSTTNNRSPSEISNFNSPISGSASAPPSPIDLFIHQSWLHANLPESQSPPPLCDDPAFLRRVYLDIIGVIPTIEESDRFLADSRPNKRELLIDELLARDQDYADQWTPFWEDALGSSNVQLQGGVPTRGNYRQWINDSFRTNKPYDLFAAQLIDTEIPGAKKPEIAEANTRKSRITYIRNESHTDTLQSAAAVAQVFMGTGMKCASCHSHFENDEWPQRRFLGYAGLFGPRDLELIRCEKKSGEFVPAKFAFDLRGTPAEIPDDEPGRLRRAAQLLTDPQNPRFAKAIVNRLWKRYLGLGLFEPVDDFRLNVPPSHPQLLDWLAYDFMSNGYDLKHTIRLILNSQTYQTAYNPALEDHFDIAKKTAPRYFRSPTLRRLTAEQVVDSLRVAATQKLDPAARLYHQDRSTALSRALGKPASRNEISTLRPDDNAVVQALELLNGEEWNALIYSSPILQESVEAQASTTPAQSQVRLASLTSTLPLPNRSDTFTQPITLLYRATLTRPPRDNELSLARSFLDSIPHAAPTPPHELTLIDDDTPPNAHLVGDWNWVTSPVSKGHRAHQQTAMNKPAQHYAIANTGSPVSPLDTLFVDVYLDPKDPPREVMIQWNDGSMSTDWDHRAYWGEDLINFNRGQTLVHTHLGPLPEPGKWVHLEVPASQVGFTTPTHIVGLSFDQYGGTVTFDNAGLIHREPGPEYQALGDLLWTLTSSPEFHYIR